MLKLSAVQAVYRSMILNLVYTIYFCYALH